MKVRITTLFGITIFSTAIFFSNSFAQIVPPKGTPAPVATPKASIAPAPVASTPSVTTPPAAAPSPAPATPEVLQEAGKFHFGSDPTVWIMILIFNLALFVVIEKIYILKKNRGDNARLVTLLTEKLHSGANPTDLATEAAAIEFGMEGRVASATLKGWAFGEHAMQEYTEASLIAERRSLEKRLVILSTLGNNTPFIGLLGTVLGIMKAFRDLAEMGDSGPSVVMRGISEALIATAMGLAVAIPVVIAYNALSRIIKDKLSQAEEIATLLRAIKLSK